MIQIQEVFPPRKLSGLTSLLINFNFNEEVISTLKSFPTYVYHKKDYTWELPSCYLQRLLDSLTLIDNVQLQLFNWPENGLVDLQVVNPMYSAPLTEAEINSFKLKPLEHQVTAVNYGLSHPNFLLLDSMGLGKTFEVIALAQTLKNRGAIDHCLIICGVNAVKQNWKREVLKFSHETCTILGEKISKSGKTSYTSIPDRSKQINSGINDFFIVTNIESLRSDDLTKSISNFIKKCDGRVLIAVDEIHKCSNKSSSQGNNLLKLKANYRVAMTGTLLTNNPISTYLPLNWIGVDQATLTNFKSQYCTFGGFHDSQVTGYKNLDLLQEEIDACSIRRTLKDVRSSMPPKTVTTELIEMSDQHRKFYDAIVDGIKEEADKIELKSSNLLALTTRLRQATACPTILTTQDILSSKIERCIEIVDELVSQGEKVVILSTFREPVYQLAKLLSHYDPLVSTGDTDESIFDNNNVRFQNDPNSKVYLGTFGKCSTGITLNAASYLIAIDENWTSAQNNQAWDRIYRVTNENPANITILICKDSIDERVHEITNTKQELSDYVVDGIENELSKSLQHEMLNIIRGL